MLWMVSRAIRRTCTVNEFPWLKPTTLLGIYVGESNNSMVSEWWCEMNFVHECVSLPEFGFGNQSLLWWVDHFGSGKQEVWLLLWALLVVVFRGTRFGWVYIKESKKDTNPILRQTHGAHLIHLFFLCVCGFCIWP